MCFTTVHIWPNKVDWYRGLFRGSRLVVIKTFSPIPAHRNINDLTQLIRERRILSGLLKGVEGIITLLDEIRNPQTRVVQALVYERFPFTLDWVHEHNPLTKAEVKTIARQLLRALAIMRENDIVHTGTTRIPEECGSPF